MNIKILTKFSQKNIIICAICFSALLTTVNDSNFLKETTILHSIENFVQRFLLTDANKNEICDKAGSSLFDKYKNSQYTESFGNKSPNKYQTAIINYIRNSDGKYIKDYLPRVAIFIVFLVLAVISLICWIFCCICSCCPCCCCKKDVPNFSAYRHICLYISLIGSLLVIIFSIISLILFPSVNKRANGIVCSFIKTIDHLIYGLNEDFPGNTWEGANNIIKTFENTAKIYSESQQLSEIESRKSEVKATSPSDSTLQKIKEDIVDFKYLIDDTKFLSNTDFSRWQNELVKLRDKFKKVEDDKLNDVYDFMKDYTNKLIKKIFYSFFIVSLIFGVLSIVLVLLYYKLKLCAIKGIYIFIWNLEMLFTFAIIVLSAALGIAGYLTKDGTVVVQYIRSSKNLNDPNSIIFDYDNNTSQYIDTCLNQNGDLSSKFFVINESSFKEGLDGLNGIKEKYQNYQKTIEEGHYSGDDVKYQEIIKNACQSIINKTDQKIELLNSVKSITTKTNCSFSGSDFNIIVSEVDAISGGLIALTALAFLIGCFLGISVGFGIKVMNKFKEDDIQIQQVQVIHAQNNSTVTTQGNFIDYHNYYNPNMKYKF